jgi:hypothetical protein
MAGQDGKVNAQPWDERQAEGEPRNKKQETQIRGGDTTTGVFVAPALDEYGK